MKSSIFWLLIGVDDAVALARVEHQVQTVRRCPKHCSFCSMWRTDGPKPRPRPVNPVIEEIVELRRMGFRFVALADDNFYPVTLEDLRMADRREDKTRYDQLKALRDERFELMAQMEKLPIWCSTPRSRWRRPRTPSSSTRCGGPASWARWSASRR